MKVSAFALAGDSFRVAVTRLKDGAIALDVLNDQTDIVLHFDGAQEAALFGLAITAAAQQHVKPPRKEKHGKEDAEVPEVQA